MTRRATWPLFAVSVLLTAVLVALWARFGAQARHEPILDSHNWAPKAVETARLAAVVLPPPPAEPAPTSNPASAPASGPKSADDRRAEPPVQVRTPAAAAAAVVPLRPSRQVVAKPRPEVSENGDPAAQIVHPLVPHAPRLALKPIPEAGAEVAATPTDAEMKFAATKSPALPHEDSSPVPPAAEATVTGRALLRLLEHGDGPRIEIAWPSSGAERTALFEVFRRCYGVTVAVIDDADRLFTAGQRPGEPWAIDMDRYSGFVRLSDGIVSADQAKEVDLIRSRQADLIRAEPVHVFLRGADAALLGGLQGVIGDGYTRARAIHADYRLDRGRVLVERIRVDGQPMTGRIDLSSAAKRGCG